MVCFEKFCKWGFLLCLDFEWNFHELLKIFVSLKLDGKFIYEHLFIVKLKKDFFKIIRILKDVCLNDSMHETSEISWINPLKLFIILCTFLRRLITKNYYISLFRLVCITIISLAENNIRILARWWNHSILTPFLNNRM